MANEMNRMAFGKRLIELADKYEYMVMNADTKSCGLENFGDLYPHRCFNFGIAEQNLVAASAGAALCGEKVFFATFAVFASMRACEQVRTFICYPNLDVVILASHGGLQTGADGATHIAVEDVAIMRAIPNMCVLEPSDAVCAKKMVELSLMHKGPLYIRFPKAATPVLHEFDNYDIEIGKGRIFIENGYDCAIFASGWILNYAKQAAKELFMEGIKVTVIEIHTVKPIDSNLVINLAKKCGCVVTVEDHSIIGGLGSAVSEILGENYPVFIERIGIRDVFGESGTPEELYQANKMSISDIVDAVKRVLIHRVIDNE